MALKKWVTCRAPRRMASTACSYVASLWPITGTMPWAVSAGMAAIASPSSGANVHSAMCPPAAA